MSELPVSAKTYFSDFAFDVIEVAVIRDGVDINTANGLKNIKKGRPYVSFMYGTDVCVGDILCIGEETKTVYEIQTDTYNGENQLINAFYR